MVSIDARTAAVVRRRAREFGMSETDFVRRAVSVYLDVLEGTAPRDPWTPVPIYGTYEGHRVEGLFLPATRRVTVTTEPIAGARFKSPSGAARAVVAALNPGRVHSQSNGWRFWRLVESDERLEVLRRPA
jgi:hypothetical protein